MKNIVSTEVKPAAPVFTVERPLEAIRADFTVNGTEVLFKAGAKVTGEEMAYLLSEEMREQDSKTIRMANMMRLSRALPAVKVEGQDVIAFDYIKGKLKATAPTEGAFYTMFQLVEALDVIEVNKLGNVSPFSVKNAMSALRKSDALPKAGSGEPLKLKAGKAPSLVKALKEGATQAKVAEIVGKMGTAKKKTPSTPPAPEGDTTKVKQTVEGVKASLIAVRGQWELAVQEGLKIDDIRKACREEVQNLARLAGWDVVELKGAQPPKK